MKNRFYSAYASLKPYVLHSKTYFVYTKVYFDPLVIQKLHRYTEIVTTATA